MSEIEYDSTELKEKDASMLNLKECPPSLASRLDRMQQLCENASGEIVSPQVLAHIIFNWELQL
jgi:hypothetical protein